MLRMKEIRGFIGQVAVIATRRVPLKCNCPKYNLRSYGSNAHAAKGISHSNGVQISKRHNPFLVGKVIPKTVLSSSSLFIPQRNMITFVLRALRAVTKVRYLVLGSLGGGAVGAKLTYDKWKEKWETFIEGLPDSGWFKDYIDYGEILKSFHAMGDSFNEGSAQMKEYWKEAKDILFGIRDDIIESEASPPVVSAAIFGPSEKDEEVPQAKSEERKLREHLERAQEELLEMQQRFQREIDRLEQENKDLRKQLMLRGNSRPSNGRKIRRSLIDMYSDALDLLSEYDASYRIQDHLPRVVVVGDQSAGKTSVLEMIARARIFPRGAGEMMTRCPIMVTLTEGPNHIAHFKGSSHEYDLTKESDLRLLRQEVELRMANNLKKGQTVSTDVISMYVKGPGLPRMVLVDLPGIISTVTAGMQSDTKDAISDVSKYYMSNPNAIILCVQDGSVDAERSIVTDLVNKMDPMGKRTIFVLTKTDIAEQSEASPSRIKKILSGKLFPMRAMGYYAVVTGTGSTLDSIEAIRQYEEDFFRNSKLFKTGVLKASQMTTQNLSFAVASCFWNMVRESIEQQADTFKARKFNLETEWKNNYPAVRELDRDELFDKARGEILDEVLSLSQITPQQWEEIIYKNLWTAISDHAIENIYLPSAQTNSPITFKTQIDISLKQWADRLLPDTGVKVGWDTLLEEFTKAMQEGVEVGGRKDAHSPLFEDLKSRVRNECAVNHSWQSRAQDSLRVIQLTALEDSSVADKQQWDNAIRFMEETLQQELSKTNNELSDLVGPGWQERWLYWTSRSKDQHVQNEIKKELERLLQVDVNHSPGLAEDEVTTVKKNLQTNNVEADPGTINKVWRTLYRRHFLENASDGCQECRKAFYHRHLAKSELECNDVVLFWRIQRMLQSTSNALRQQIMNTEARRLENEVKQVLDEIGQELELKKELIKGRQVDLAEELKRVRHIQDSLEQFIEALKREKTS